MYFQVVRMYDRGVKKDSEALLCEGPQIGDLSVVVVGEDTLKRDCLVAVLRVFKLGAGPATTAA